MCKVFYSILGVFLLSATTVSANVVVRTADQLEVAVGDIVAGELVAVGLPVTLSNNVEEDATIIGNRVNVNGTVGGDLLAAGFFVDINSAVADDVRIIAGEVTISDSIAGDLVVAGGTVTILSTASIGGDVVIYGGTVDIAGSVAGDVVGVMENLQINAAIGGAVNVTVTQLILGPQAAITGAVQYTSANLLTQSLSASVAGAVVRNDPPPLQASVGPTVPLMVFLVGLFSTLVWYLSSKRSLTAVVNRTTAHVVRSAFIGVVTPIAAVIIIGILFVSQLGVYVGVVGLFALITVVLLAGAAAAPVIGQLLLQLLQHPTKVGPLPIVLGALIMTAALFVPVVGMILVAIAVLVTLGGLIDLLVQTNR